MFVIVLILSVSFKSTKSLIAWGEAKTKTFTQSNGFNVTIHYAAYEKYGYQEIINNQPLYSSLLSTYQHCIDQCNRIKGCVTAQYDSVNKNCTLYDVSCMSTDEYNCQPSINMIQFERQNPCQDELLCEHGSICRANFTNQTYFCDYCDPPYTGKHCNETIEGEIVNTDPIPDDIRLGKNTTCNTIRFNFDITSGENYLWIHPWRDNRKIKVWCYPDGYTAILRQIRNEDGELTGPYNKIDDLRDGLEIPGHHQFQSSALKQLYRAVRFRGVQFSCENVKWGRIVGESGQFLRYFTFSSDNLPNGCVTKTWGSQNPSNCHDFVNGTWSSNQIDPNDRLWDSVFNHVNGDTFSLHKNRWGCFEPLSSEHQNGAYYLILVK